ncbi:MAG TPA: hypothetical protein VMV87_02380 [Burkholderiales bacterium]|nr:hypothetical protein [Burkholderiales bacterium]
MTARFAYRRARAAAKTPAAAKPTRAPARPAASLPKGALPALRDAFKKVRVSRAGGAGLATIFIPWGEFEHMRSFADESDEVVENACVAASKFVAEESDRTWSETVASGAMLELMLAFQGRRKVMPRRKAK